jgi:hypothetical protein
MSRTIRQLRSAALGMCFAGTLGFGATQALASPREEPEQQICRDSVCSTACRTLGFPGGFCAGESCVCYLGR